MKYESLVTKIFKLNSANDHKYYKAFKNDTPVIIKNKKYKIYARSITLKYQSIHHFVFYKLSCIDDRLI